MRRTVSTLALGLIAAVAVAAVATSCGSSSTAPTNKTYIATMLPANELPTAKTTTGTGVATFVDNGTEIDWTMSLTGMTGVFASHIHLGNAATIGPVIFNLFIPNGTNTATLNGVVGSGSITNANNVTISLDSLRVLFNNGNAYANVHTTANGAGEIRGQIAPK
jgi:CHRD domain